MGELKKMLDGSSSRNPGVNAAYETAGRGIRYPEPSKTPRNALELWKGPIPDDIEKHMQRAQVTNPRFGYKELQHGDQVTVLQINATGGAEVRTRKDKIHHVTAADFRFFFKLLEPPKEVPAGSWYEIVPKPGSKNLSRSEMPRAPGSQSHAPSRTPDAPAPGDTRGVTGAFGGNSKSGKAVSASSAPPAPSPPIKTPNNPPVRKKVGWNSIGSVRIWIGQKVKATDSSHTWSGALNYDNGWVGEVTGYDGKKYKVKWETDGTSVELPPKFQKETRMSFKNMDKTFHWRRRLLSQAQQFLPISTIHDRLADAEDSQT